MEATVEESKVPGQPLQTPEIPKNQPRKKSEARVRQVTVPSSMYYDSSTFKILVNLLQLHVSQKSAKPKTIGELEDIIHEAIDNIYSVSTLNRSERDKLDKKILMQKRMKSVQVNIKAIHKDKVYQEALKNYDVSSLHEKVVYYWEMKKKIDHMEKCLDLAKERCCKSVLTSSSGIFLKLSLLSIIWLNLSIFLTIEFLSPPPLI